MTHGDVSCNREINEAGGAALQSGLKDTCLRDLLLHTLFLLSTVVAINELRDTRFKGISAMLPVDLGPPHVKQLPAPLRPPGTAVDGVQGRKSLDNAPSSPAAESTLLRQVPSLLGVRSGQADGTCPTVWEDLLACCRDSQLNVRWFRKECRPLRLSRSASGSPCTLHRLGRNRDLGSSTALTEGIPAHNDVAKVNDAQKSPCQEGRVRKIGRAHV